MVLNRHLHKKDLYGVLLGNYVDQGEKMLLKY